ncbi:4Fe-4S cluster-binding domain-containing protein [Synechococcales cyanobacterium C]|uniref:7-carboxy-7-deazaguanine synthase n=1 Tax=Petrachloros mirabilis ULC683 TaxID=2781853 RepID=A0A8K2A8X3_9CYAN|nr:7-carboxy-7-deazaguanine synthase QueE [Petrachloros mirabilis]NCJ07540.1 4Fe-4S cluster-binding domain-containing protein [Petrachloros mirabilis ULC683]
MPLPNLQVIPGAVQKNIDVTANLVEVFSAIQGEGLNVGTRQIFLRFGGCDLRCRFCDSVHTWHPSNLCRVEQAPGARDFITHPNPVAIAPLLDWVARQHQPPNLHDSISLTGGEPLLQAPFLAAFLPQVRDRTPLPIYLETGGHLPEALDLVLPYLNSVGMDLKLPSVSGEAHWEAHDQFLRRCVDARMEVFCKLIVSNETAIADLDQATALIGAVDPRLPVYLQPVTPTSSASPWLPPSPEQVLAWQAQMKQTLIQVRVVPQTHKAIGQL